MMSNQDVGFILSNVPYREYDAMVLFLGKEYGLLRFVLRGYYRPTAKQTSLGLEFTQVRLRFTYHENRLLRIQNGELVNAYSNFRSDYDWLIQMSLVTELINRFYDKKDRDYWYNLMDSLFESMSLEKIILMLVSLIKKLGITPHISSCVMSGSGVVSDFSVEKGGFVSKQYRTHGSVVDLEMLQMIRSLFTHKDFKILYLENYKDTKKLANLLIQYLEYHEGIRLNSWKLMY